jgi:peptidoglycan/xylan/chitin deacetylase (PgdA/CDA1 family)
VVEELVRANEAITAVTADPPHCMRPPFLAADDRVRRIVAGLGLAVIISNVDPKDWSFPGTAAIVSYVLGHTDGGDIISLHEGVGAETLAALPAIIEGLQAKGLEFVALCSTAVLGPPG